MAFVSPYSEEQLEFMRKSYVKHLQPPREVARLVNEKFGLSVNARQISTLADDRGWSEKRKKAKALHPPAVTQAQQNQLVEQHAQRVVEQQARLGQKIMDKAEKFIEGASTAKTLGSAASAAKTGVALSRQAVGLDANGQGGGTRVFNFNFANAADSPRNLKNVTPEVQEAPEIVDQDS